MLESQYLQSLATRKQINEFSIYREYCQHVFLSHFYSKRGSDMYLFKGGTALRIIFQSPRYSVDLDFSTASIHEKAIEELLLSVIEDFEREGFSLSNIPSSGPTSGGYLSFLDFSNQLFNARIQLNIQRKDERSLGANSKLVINEFTPPYSLTYLRDDILISEKLEAFLTREHAKERDFFDLYYILNDNYLRKCIKPYEGLKRQLLERLNALDDSEIRFGLKNLLPINYHPLLVNSNLKSQIRRLIDSYLN